MLSFFFQNHNNKIYVQDMSWGNVLTKSMYKLSLPKELHVGIVVVLKTSTKSNISKTWRKKYIAFLFQAMFSLPFLKGGSAFKGS